MTRRHLRLLTAALSTSCALAIGLSESSARAEGDTPAPKMSRTKTSEDVPKAIMPCFETLADGSTRLFIELSKPVAYEAKSGHGSVTYVLKGARVERRNNLNPLVTTFFNTPVTTAQLVSRGRDLAFVLALRSNVEPVVTMSSNGDGGAVMSIQFPKGDYLPPPTPDEPKFEPPATPSAEVTNVATPAASSPPPPRAAPANRPRSGGHGRRHGASGPTSPSGGASP